MEINLFNTSTKFTLEKLAQGLLMVDAVKSFSLISNFYLKRQQKSKRAEKQNCCLERSKA